MTGERDFIENTFESPTEEISPRSVESGLFKSVLESNFSNEIEREQLIWLTSEDQEPEPSDVTPSPKTAKDGPWEPFLNEPDSENQRFIVTYSGPYAQRLEINRKNAERLMEVAALDGKIVVTDLVPERGRSISGVNPDGSVSAKRRLFWGERFPTSVDEESKYSRITLIPEGWRVEIAGQKILEDLIERKSNKQLDRRFVIGFNGELKSAI